MKKLQPISILSLCVFAVVLTTGSPCPAQSKTLDLAHRKLENVHIKEVSMLGLFSHFSFAYNIPTGLELARNGDETISYRIDFKKGTLSDLLNQFFSKNEQYTWTIENGVLSVFPAHDYREPLLEELLTTNISHFSIKAKTDTWGFGESLVATPEIKRILARRGVTHDVGYPGGFYIQQLGRQFSLDVSKVTMKSILDQVVKGSPVARYWVIATQDSGKKIFLRVRAAFEY